MEIVKDIFNGDLYIIISESDGVIQLEQVRTGYMVACLKDKLDGRYNRIPSDVVERFKKGLLKEKWNMLNS